MIYIVVAVVLCFLSFVFGVRITYKYYNRIKAQKDLKNYCSPIKEK